MAVILLNFAVLGAQAGRAERPAQEQPAQEKPVQEKPNIDQASLNLSEISETEISEAKGLLTSLGYWIDPDASQSESDAQFRHALATFRKVEGLKATGKLTIADLRWMRAAGRPRAIAADYAHVEVDLKRQILMVIDEDGETVKVLPVSSGSGQLFTSEGRTRRAITPRGRFRVQRKIAGWRKSPLGLMYYPVYIAGGIAIHGSPSVPRRPASHGCIRIPMYAAKPFHDSTPIGTVVLVY